MCSPLSDDRVAVSGETVTFLQIEDGLPDFVGECREVRLAGVEGVGQVSECSAGQQRLQAVPECGCGDWSPDVAWLSNNAPTAVLEKQILHVISMTGTSPG